MGHFTTHLFAHLLKEIIRGQHTRSFRKNGTGGHAVRQPRQGLALASVQPPPLPRGPARQGARRPRQPARPDAARRLAELCASGRLD